MQPAFRKALPDDAPAMARLIVLAWQKAYRGILSDALLDSRSAEDSTRKILSGIKNRPEFRYYVLEQDKRIAGVSVVCPSQDSDVRHAANIQAFYIHPDMQHQGLGRVLMQNTLAAIHAEHAQQTAILWVLKNNHSARAFYEKMGFIADGGAKILDDLENTPAVRYRYTRQGSV